MADIAVELVLDAHATIGEAPTWVAAERALYWIDIKAPALFRYHEASGAQRRWTLAADVGAFALIEKPPGAIVALRDGLARLDFETGAIETIGPPPFEPALFRFNEGACDPTGRFWVGVMFDPVEGDPPPETASLHSFTLAGGLRAEPDVAELHNGMAWTADGRHFYLSHSNSGEIWRFDYDPERQRVGERHLFAAVDPSIGLPDGAAIDVDGYYWCAIHGGGRLHRYAPDGRLDDEIMLPVSQPTMCAFGGDDLATLYVTSAADGLDAGALAAEPHAGGVFRLRPGIAGIPRQPYVR